MIEEWVKKYIGIPYKTKGVTLTEGLDCLSVVELIYKNELGITLPYNEHLDTENNMDVVGDAINKEKVRWVKLDKPQKYCVVLLNIAGFPVHIGLVLNDDYMIHSLKGHNSVVERFTGAKWKSRISGFYRSEALF